MAFECILEKSNIKDTTNFTIRLLQTNVALT